MIGPLLPIPRGKKGPPFFKEWELKSPGELEELYHEYPGCNPAVRLDSIIQVDADNEPAIKKVAEMKRTGILPATLNYNTWRGVETPLYKARPGVKSFDITGGGLKLQIRTGSGHYALIPDSIFNGKSYTWVKHMGPADLDLAELPDEALERLAKDCNFSKTRFSLLEEPSRFVTQGGLDFKEGSRDSSLYTVARSLYRGGMPPQDAEHIIKILAKNCLPAFPEKEALAKIESAFKEERNLAHEIREWVSVTGVLLTATECDKELGIVTKRDRDNRRQVFGRLVTEGILERVGGKVGVFRVIEKECPEIDFLNADTRGPLPIKWPLELEKLVNIYRKNIAIVAGSKDSGKTAFLLNLVRLNQDRFPVVYFCSEMAAEELSLRLTNFGFPLASWKFKPIERASNFADVIDPGALNILDFFEITDNFYLIAGEIRKIYEKLGDGVAVIGIQKDEGAKLGRGKDFSMEKARLYVTLDKGAPNNELKIISGKNWAQPGINPAGIVLRFKLVNGAKFIEIPE